MVALKYLKIASGFQVVVETVAGLLSYMYAGRCAQQGKQDLDN